MGPIYKFVMAMLAKGAGKKTGIATISKATGPEVQDAFTRVHTILRNMGVDVTKLKSPDEVKKFLNMYNSWVKQQKPRVIGQDHPEFKGITEKLLGKKSNVETFQGFTPRVQQDVDEIIKNIKSKEPIEAMKEANSVIGRKGKYKNLSHEEADRILKETDDHIFQRDIPEEDFASGGIARVKFNAGREGELFGIPWENIKEYQEKKRRGEIMDRTSPLALPDDWLERLLRKFRRTETYEQSMASGGIAGQLHLYDGGRVGFKEGSWSKLKKKYKGSTLQAILDNPQLMAAELGHEGIFSLLQMLGMKEGGRVRYDKGKKVDLSKRKFMKGAGAGLGVLSMLPFVGKFFKPAAKLAKTKTLTSVPIGSAEGMPDWFVPLVNKVIGEGDDVTKKLATQERHIVHTKKLGDPKDKFADEITVTQDLDTGNVRVEYDTVHNMGEAPIQLDYKAGEIIEEGSKKGTKTNPEFSAVESEPRVANWDGDIEWDGENVVGKVDDLLTDTTQLESYATGKKPTIKKLLKSEEKKKYVNKLNDDVMEQSDYIENKSGHLAPEDLMEAEDAAYHKSKEGLASGGRVPMFKGAMVPELDARAKINAALRAYKKYRRGEKNPRLKFKTFFEIYAGENFASGGLAGQLHLNQGGRIRYATGKKVKTEKEKWKETLKFLKEMDILLDSPFTEDDTAIDVDVEDVKYKKHGGRIRKYGGGILAATGLPGIPRMAPDGLEYDMRTGGFQPLGAREGKDDVNAKLAKNEFVMTADAVRGAGGGDINKGAQRMYDTMKKLEGKIA